MPHPTPSSIYPPASTTHAPSQQSTSPSKSTPVPDKLCVQNSERQDSLSPREQRRTKHDSLTTSDSASRSAGVITSAAAQRQPSQHLRLTSLGRIAPARESLESPTRPSSRLSQESLSSLDCHPRRPGLDDKRISLNTFLSATAPPWSVEETSARQKMHQTSSRLLRQTDDDRPFTRVSSLPPLFLSTSPLTLIFCRI